MTLWLFGLLHHLARLSSTSVKIQPPISSKHKISVGYNRDVCQILTPLLEVGNLYLKSCRPGRRVQEN